MTMQHFLNAMKAQAAAMDAARGQPRWGIVVSVDAVNHVARVMIQPEEVLSGWLPVSPLVGGGGWGVVALPQQGQQVVVIPDCGDAEHGIIIGGGFSDTDMAPSVKSAFTGDATPGQPGELLLVSSGGAVVRLCLDGTLYSSGTWNHEGTFNVKGDVTVTGEVTGKVGGQSVTLTEHEHPTAPEGAPSAPSPGT